MEGEKCKRRGVGAKSWEEVARRKRAEGETIGKVLRVQKVVYRISGRANMVKITSQETPWHEEHHTRGTAHRRDDIELHSAASKWLRQVDVENSPAGWEGLRLVQNRKAKRDWLIRERQGNQRGRVGKVRKAGT